MTPRESERPRERPEGERPEGERPRERDPERETQRERPRESERARDPEREREQGDGIIYLAGVPEVVCHAVDLR